MMSEVTICFQPNGCRLSDLHPQGANKDFDFACTQVKVQLEMMLERKMERTYFAWISIGKYDQLFFTFQVLSVPVVIGPWVDTSPDLSSVWDSSACPLVSTS